MLVWLSENIPTVITGLVLALAVTLVVGKLVRDKRQGNHSCGCNCGGCPMAGTCGGEKKKP